MKICCTQFDLKIVSNNIIVEMTKPEYLKRVCTHISRKYIFWRRRPVQDKSEQSFSILFISSLHYTHYPIIGNIVNYIKIQYAKICEIHCKWAVKNTQKHLFYVILLYYLVIYYSKTSSVILTNMLFFVTVI